jgi:hypothetical protein
MNATIEWLLRELDEAIASLADTDDANRYRGGRMAEHAQAYNAGWHESSRKSHADRLERQVESLRKELAGLEA